MKAKLIKDSDGYWLDISNDVITKRPLTDFGQLSIKNCEAIEFGYDLDELAREITDKEHLLATQYSKGFEKGIIVGFQKALEILGDKKFSVKDMEKLMFATLEFTDTQEEGETYPFLKSFIQSLQQNQWDVEICCYLGNGDKESDSFKDTFVTNTGIPKLDSDGCLILRRI